MLSKCKFCIDSGFYNALVVLDTCLCVDLVLMINRPLQSKEKRMKVYKLMGLAAIIVSILVRSLKSGQEILNLSYGILLVIYVATAFFSAVFVVIKLTHTNITPKIRTLIMRRHVIFILFFISVNIYVFWTFIYLIKYDN